MVDKLEIEIQITEDRNSAVIGFLPICDANGSVTLSQNKLQTLIRVLGEAHVELAKGQAIPQIEGQRVNAIYDTRWYIQPEPLSEGSVISFHHPAFGPVGFVIPRRQVEQIVELLSLQLQMPTQSSGTPN